MNYPKHALEAFQRATTYRPLCYRVGSRQGQPREDGVELSEDRRELVWYSYLPAGFNDGAPSRTVKKVIARMPTPVSLEGIDPFKTDYREVA